MSPSTQHAVWAASEINRTAEAFRVAARASTVNAAVPFRTMLTAEVSCSACLAGVAHTFMPSDGVHFMQLAFDAYTAGMDAQRAKQDVDWPAVHGALNYLERTGNSFERAWVATFRPMLGREARR